MSQFSNQTAFLKTLLLYGDVEERRRLLERMTRVEREEHWSRRAVLVMALLSLACFYGLSYDSAELPQLADDGSILLADVVQGVGVACGLCLSLVIGCWIWHRGALNRIREDSRRFILGILESKARPATSGPAPLLLGRDAERPSRQADYLQLIHLRQPCPR